MLESRITAQLTRRAAALIEGRFDEILHDYVFPLPVDLLTTRIVVQGPSQARAMLALQRQAMLDNQVVSLQPRVTALGLPRAGRLRFWVDWRETALPPHPVRVASAVYFCRQAGTGFRIEMIHYQRLSAPELQPHLAQLALSA